MASIRKGWRRTLRLESPIGIFVLLSAVTLATAALTSASARSLTRPPTSHCKIVRKVVHGKKKRVRVCTRPKPALPQAGSVAATIPIGAAIQAIATSDNAVWVLSDDRRLIRVDPATNRVAATIALPESEWPEAVVAAGDGAVWVTVASPDTLAHPELDSLLRIDPQTNQIVARISVGRSPTGVAVTADSVWTANHRAEGADWDPNTRTRSGVYTVSRVSVASNSEVSRPVVETRPKKGDPWGYFCCGPSGMTFAAGSIWTTDPDGGRGMLIRVDPATNAVLARISFAQSKAAVCGNMVGDDSAVWLVDGCDNPSVARIDPQTNQIAAIIYPGGDATNDLALGFGSLWVTTSGPNGQLVGLNRIDPATNKIVARTKIDFAQAVAIGDGSVWVGNVHERLLRITPR
jgi:streptogramin lyase